jgi:phage/plasmid-associated DNA primase
MISTKENSRDCIVEWGDEACEPDVRAATSGDALYGSYVLWAKQRGAPVCTERMFLLNLSDAGLPKILRNGKRMWLGIRVKPEYAEFPEDESVKPAKGNMEWRESVNNSIVDWAAERCVMGAQDTAWADEMYRDYVAWSGSVIGRVAFGTAMSKLSNVWCKPRQPSHLGGKPVKRTMYLGMRLANQPEPVEYVNPAPKEKDFEDMTPQEQQEYLDQEI